MSPIYDVRCAGCYKIFESFKPLDDPFNDKCPACNCDNLEIVFTKANKAKLKGEGWHDSDYDKHGRKK